MVTEVPTLIDCPVVRRGCRDRLSRANNIISSCYLMWRILCLRLRLLASFDT